VVYEIGDLFVVSTLSHQSHLGLPLLKKRNFSSDRSVGVKKYELYNINEWLKWMWSYDMRRNSPYRSQEAPFLEQCLMPIDFHYYWGR
jgi:hypothetical protein